MASDDIETYQAGGLWHNRLCGNPQVLSSHQAKGDAVEAGRSLARERAVDHIVRNITGRATSTCSYRRAQR